MNPVYPCDAGRLSCWPPAQVVEPWAQWTAMPSKSVTAFEEFAFASADCGEFAPKTVVMSPKEAVLTFSSSMSATPIPPTLQPCRVYGIHGAGMFVPSGWMRLNTFVAAVSVQYWNVLGKLNEPDGLVRTKLLLTVWP